MQTQSTKLLTLFIISSVVSLLVISIAIFFGIRTVYRQHVIEIAQQQSVSIAQALLIQESDLLANGDLDTAGDLSAPATSFHLLDRRMHDYLMPFDIVKIKVFNRQAQVIYSTDPNIIGKFDRDNLRLAAALQGKIDTALRMNDSLVDLAEEKRINIDVVETYVPARNAAGNVIGSLELYVDVTRYRGRLRDTLATSMTLISAILLLTFGVLFLIMRQGTGQLGKYESQLHAMALTDDLTGIANRRFLLDRAEEEFARAHRENARVRYAANVGFVLVDVDNFKEINDSRGHHVGDMVLREVADRMQNAVRRYDLVGRYGGEEFLILMPNCAKAQVHEVADRIWLDIRGTPIRVNELEIRVTVSVGYACIEATDAGVKDVIKRADQALYKAKADGRDRVATL